jgi:hypothetical protein
MACFWVASAHPIKSEMSVAIPKQQTREPIGIDIILVCRKVSEGQSDTNMSLQSVIEHASGEAEAQVLRLRGAGQSLSRNDVQAIFMAQVVALLSRNSAGSVIFDLFDEIESEAGTIVGQIHTE